MINNENLEARVRDLEIMSTTMLDVIERNRFEIAALRTALSALIDDLRPDDPIRSDQWLDGLLSIAAGNADIYLAAVRTTIAKLHHADRELLEATEDEREAVMDLLSDMFTALKTSKRAPG